MAKNKDELAKQDNTGTKDQMKADRSTMLHMQRIGLGLLGADTYPTVVADDIGGGFGAKGSIAREDVAIAAAAIEMGKSIKWIEDRVENLTDGGQAREDPVHPEPVLVPLQAGVDVPQLGQGVHVGGL